MIHIFLQANEKAERVPFMNLTLGVQHDSVTIDVLLPGGEGIHSLVHDGDSVTLQGLSFEGAQHDRT